VDSGNGLTFGIHVARQIRYSGTGCRQAPEQHPDSIRYGRSHLNANPHQHPTSQFLDMTIRIPPELIFHIVGFLQDSKPDLFACSLCCSALAAVTRPLLFHTLRTDLGSRAADQFKSLLESGPEVLTLIKRIDAEISNNKPEANQRTVVVISQIMASHPIQHTPPTVGIVIQAGGPSLHEFSQPLLSCLNPAIHWVTSLDLSLNFVADIQFRDFVLEFPRLKSLTLGYVLLTTGFHTPLHGESEISHITLRETALGGSSRISWFLSHNALALPSLTSLDIRFPMHSRASGQVAEPYTPMVRMLRFGVPIIPNRNRDWNKITCDACKF